MSRNAPRHPRGPVRSRQDVQESLRPLEIDDEHGGGRDQKEQRDERSGETHEWRPVAQQPEQGRQEHRAGRNALGQQVDDQIDAPCLLVRHVVVHAGSPGRNGSGSAAPSGRRWTSPSRNMNRPRRNFRPDRALVGSQIEDLRPGALFRLAHHEHLALHDLGDFAFRIVEIPEDPTLGRAHAHAGRLELVLDPVRAEVALLGGPRVRIDEQLIVRASDHARPAADARVAVEIDDAVTAPEQRVGRADLHARRFRALIAETGRNNRCVSGNVPFSTVFTQQRLAPTGMSCSALQAIVHAWHPMHLRRSMTNP